MNKPEATSVKRKQRVGTYNSWRRRLMYLLDYLSKSITFNDVYIIHPAPKYSPVKCSKNQISHTCERETKFSPLVEWRSY